MNIDSLHHLLTVVEALVPEGEITVIGSSALLVAFPELGQPGKVLETSLDADGLLDVSELDTCAEVLMESVGSASRFHKVYGYYFDVMRPSIGETFPECWKQRRSVVTGLRRSYALDVYDVAAAKLRVGREKDISLVQDLMNRNLVQHDLLQQRMRQMSMTEKEITVSHQRLEQLASSEQE